MRAAAEMVAMALQCSRSSSSLGVVPPTSRFASSTSPERRGLHTPEVVVVDASDDSRTRGNGRSVSACPVDPLSGWRGSYDGWLSNEGLIHVGGDVVAFLDDDAYVRQGWCEGIIGAFTDPKVGAVVGRTCNGAPGEENEGRELVGRGLPDGT